jgi:SAM-dependent methyltransferase
VRTPSALCLHRYLPVEFHELAANEAATAPIAVLELGCGNGSSVLAVLRCAVCLQCLWWRAVSETRAPLTRVSGVARGRANAAAVVYACDFSESAVRLMQANVAAAAIPDGSARCVGFVCDVASQQVHQHLADAVAIAEQAVAAEVEGGGECGEAAAAPPLPALRTQMDYVLMVFVLSAVCPTRAVTFLRNACAPLRPGGIVLVRAPLPPSLSLRRAPLSPYLPAFLSHRRSDALPADWRLREARAHSSETTGCTT